MVEMVMFNIQRGITKKVGKPELRFIHMFCTLSHGALHWTEV